MNGKIQCKKVLVEFLVNIKSNYKLEIVFAYIIIYVYKYVMYFSGMTIIFCILLFVVLSTYFYTIITNLHIVCWTPVEPVQKC